MVWVLYFLVPWLIALFRPKTALLCAVFFLPWLGLYVDIGLQVTPYQAFITPLIALYGTQRLLHKKSFSRASLPVGIWLFLAFAIFWTLVQIPLVPKYVTHTGAYRSSSLRMIFQCVMLIIDFSPLVIIPWLLNTLDDYQLMLKAYLASCLTLCALGMFQIAAWLYSGQDIFPIGMVNSLLGTSTFATTRSAILQAANTDLLRMSSFGREPKELGMSLIVGMLLIQVFGNLAKRRMLLHVTWSTLFVSTLLTGSTSAYYLWAIGTVIHLFLIAILGRIRGFQSITLPRGFRSLLILCIGLALIASAGAFGDLDSAKEVLRARTIDRQVYEDFDEVVFDFLANEPIYAIAGTGLGAAHVYAHKYIPVQYMHYMKQEIFVARSAILKTVSECGFIGLAFLLFGIFSVPHRLYAFLKRSPANFTWTHHLTTHLLFMFIVLAIEYLARINLFPQLAVFSGVCLAWTSSLAPAYRKSPKTFHVAPGIRLHATPSNVRAG